MPLPSRTFGGKVYRRLRLGVDLWEVIPFSKGLGVKYSFHWGYVRCGGGDTPAGIGRGLQPLLVVSLGCVLVKL